MINAGKLNRLISVRKPSTWTRSTDGQPIFVWTTVLDSVWADRQPISGREMFRADVRWSEITMRWIMRHSTAVTPDCRIVDLGDSSAEYDIKAVIDIDDKQSRLEVLTKKRE